MVAIKRAIEPYERQKAKERQKILNNEETVSEKFSTAKGRALDNIAGFVGVSRPTLQKAEDIVTAAKKD